MSCALGYCPIRLFSVLWADSRARHFLGFCGKLCVCVVIFFIYKLVMVNFFYSFKDIPEAQSFVFVFNLKKPLHFIHWEVFIGTLCAPPPIPYSLQITKYSRGKDVINEQCTIINVLSGTRIDSRVLLLEKCVMMFHQISVVLFFQGA